MKCFNCGRDADYYSLDGRWSCYDCQNAWQVSGGAVIGMAVIILLSIVLLLFFSVRIPFDKYPASRW